MALPGVGSGLALTASQRGPRVETNIPQLYHLRLGANEVPAGPLLASPSWDRPVTAVSYLVRSWRRQVPRLTGYKKLTMERRGTTGRYVL